MIKVETGSNQIFRYDNVLSKETCDEICEYLYEEKGRKMASEKGGVPWADNDTNDTLHFSQIPNNLLKTKILFHRQRVKNLVMSCFNEPAFVEFTHLVAWRTGKSQNRHKDNGYRENDPLRFRKFTTVTYLNENFEGGETFIQTEHGKDYISKPKTGSVVLYYSDERAQHGVNLITNGIRITLPIWFCSNYEHSEERNDNLNKLPDIPSINHAHISSNTPPAIILRTPQNRNRIRIN